MATPSQSRSRHDREGTGSKGVGAKEAMACMGRTWDIHSVTRAGRDIGLYRHHRLTWDPEGPLPYKWQGEGKPAHLAPSEIRKGGTKIMVTDRKEGFPRLTTARMESWCKKLEQNYRPALANGLSIRISNPEIACDYTLRNRAFDVELFVSFVQQINLTVEGRQVEVRYGVLRQPDDILSGCHYILGPRVIDDSLGINGLSIPLRCYIDVILDPEWKFFLSTNKERVRYRDEIDEAVATALKIWIEAQIKESINLKISIQLGNAAAPINQVLDMLNPSKTGQWKAKQREPNKKREEESPDPEGPNEAEVPRRIMGKRRRQAMKGEGEFGVDKIDKTSRCLTLVIKDEMLGNKLWRGAIINGIATIFINVDPVFQPGMMNTIMHHQEKITDIAAMAYADMVSQRAKDFDAAFAALRGKGYNIDESTDPLEIRRLLGNFLVAELARQVIPKRKVA